MIRNFFSRLMYGRYGSDQLSTGLLVLWLVLWVLSSFIHNAAASNILNILSYAVILFGLFRMFSRNYNRRRAENEKFLALIGPISHRILQSRARAKDRDHCYFKCPSCNQILRVPKGKGMINITCRNCGTMFQKKT